MSSGDELEGYEPSTPGPAPKKAAARTTTQRAVAGPSSKPIKIGPPKKGARKEPQPPPDVEEVEEVAEVMTISSDDEEKKSRKANANKAKGNGKTAQALTNGTTKPKGKTKADTSSHVADDVMDIDAPQLPDSDPVPAVRPAKRRSTSKASPAVDANTVAARKEKRELEAMKREVERLTQRLEDADARNLTLSEQLERALKIRESEPEKMLNQRVEQYQATMDAQHELIQEQTRKLAELKALSDSGNLQKPPFMTREDAEAETRALSAKVKNLTETLRAKDKYIADTLKEKDARIAELEEDTRVLRVQLDNEIKMAKAQSQQRVIRNVPTAEADKMKDEVIKLYERLTNILILRTEHSKFQLYDLPQLRFHCVYTHVNENADAADAGQVQSLNFDLYDTWARRDGVDLDLETDLDIAREDLEMKTMYIPRDLDKESEEFRGRLGFFAEQFLFSQSQTNVFLKSLGEALGNKQSAPSEEGEIDELVGEGDSDIQDVTMAP